MRKGVLAALLLAAVAVRAQEQRAVESGQVDGAPGGDARGQGALPEPSVAAEPGAPVEQGGPAGQGAQAERSAPVQQGARADLEGRARSDAFDRACIDMLHGRAPEGDRAIRTLRDACAKLMAGRADEQREAQRREQMQIAAREQLRMQAQGRVEPGQASGAVQPGQGVRAAFGQAVDELTSRRRTRELGETRGGPIGFTLVTNPVGWFNGLGINAELIRPFEDTPKLSWVLGGRYSSTDASNGTASTFGAMAGIDFFVVGRNNEGFRIGPRAEVAAGRERFQGSTTFARLGLSGEAGYNFVASNGITGLLAVGMGGRVAGDSQNDTFASFVGGEFGPYIKVGLGYSW